MPNAENDAACEGCFWGDHQRHTEPCNCEACAPVCRCLGHHFPGVSHIVPCCDVPHIDQRWSVIPPDPTPYNEIAGWSEPRVIPPGTGDDSV